MFDAGFVDVTLYALKEMKPDKNFDSRMAVNEAEKMRQIQHPNIIRYVSHFEAEQGIVYIASEFANMGDLGGAVSLQKKLEKKGEPRWQRSSYNFDSLKIKV